MLRHTPTNELGHTPNQWASLQSPTLSSLHIPPISYLYNPNNELRHTPPMSYSTNPDNELWHIPPMSYGTPQTSTNELLHTPPMSYCTLQTPTMTMSYVAPLNELRHTPTNELPCHKPQQWATPHPSNDLRHISRMSFITSLQCSVADPWHFGVDPDPRIHASD
jgi:hypothetical protein